MSETALLAGLFVALFCLTLLVPRDLWVQDEARYGEVVREMMETGQWLVPHLNGQPYPDKPPLYFWLVIAVGWLVGHGELAFRLTSTLSAAAALAAVVMLGRELFSRATGFWAGMLFVTAFITLVVGQIARMDMLLTATAAFAWLAIERFRASRRTAPLAAFWSLSVLGVAIKGPISLLFTVLPGAVLLAWTEGWRGLRALRPAAGLVVFTGLGLGWAAAVLAQGHADYLQSIWNRQLVGRAVDAWSHKEPVYFYLVLLPVLITPWTGLTVQGFRVLSRDRIPAGRSLWLFSALPFAALSLVSGKLFIYLEPLVPALAIAAAIGAADIYHRSRPSLWIAWPPVILLACCAVSVGYVTYLHLQGQAWQGYVVAGALAGLALITVPLCRRPPAQWLWGWVAVSVAVTWLVFGWLAHLINPLFSAKSMGEALARRAPPGTPVGVVRTTRGILNYYAHRVVTDLDPGEARVWWEGHPHGVLVVKTPDLERVFGRARVPASCRIHETYTVELNEYHVLGGC
jgi:4-amino-4-deoxy-L-arabinose transferase-like glycosyltransferase